MSEKIQLHHPAGKKLGRIDKEKYTVIRDAIVRALRNGPMGHKELLEEIVRDFKKTKTTFEGAVEWYMEGVKLDLEANHVINRMNEKPPHKWQLKPTTQSKNQ